MEKLEILAKIRRMAFENGGRPPGKRAFECATGVSKGGWAGKHWRSWSDALAEAGFRANRASRAYDQRTLLAALASVTRRLGRFPSYADLVLEKSRSAGFPGVDAFKRLGPQHVRPGLVRAFAGREPEFADVVAMLPPEDADQPGSDRLELGADGCVYLLQLGKHDKIGKTFDVPRRHREISLALPETPTRVHVIKTDDPAGIEQYWHKRFAEKRTNGEWLALSSADVNAFKRRKFM